jgi:hypothetical protein
MILITNNPKVQTDPNISCDKEYIAGSLKDVLIAVRDKIHKGHKLLSHPLSGSVKPNETPYKSILISKEIGNMDWDSLQIIENSIEVCEKFMRYPIKYGYNNWERLLADFSEVDYRLIVAALASAANK